MGSNNEEDQSNQSSQMHCYVKKKKKHIIKSQQCITKLVSLIFTRELETIYANMRAYLYRIKKKKKTIHTNRLYEYTAKYVVYYYNYMCASPSQENMKIQNRHEC